MKYYGVKRKLHKEEQLYSYAKLHMFLKSVLPSKHKKNRKIQYNLFFKDDKYRLKEQNNAIPKNHYLKLDSITFAEIVKREDISQLQSGLKKLIKAKKSSKYIFVNPHKGIDSMLESIDNMDNALLHGYNWVDFGAFEINNSQIADKYEGIFLKVENLNSGFLLVRIHALLSSTEKELVSSIINQDYHNKKGHITKMIGNKQGKSGGIDKYSLSHYNDAALKSDLLDEHLTCIAWELMHELNRYLPFTMHKLNITPPRIETYYTDIDYKDNNEDFWSSVGVSAHNGQFVNEQQKVFFSYQLSGRYQSSEYRKRIIYIVKDEKCSNNVFSSREDAYWHLENCSHSYFIFLLLSSLCQLAGQAVVSYKNKLDKIKLKKNGLKQLLKTRYSFEKDVELYKRFTREDSWKKNKSVLNEEFKANDQIIEKAKNAWVYTHNAFCRSSEVEAEQVKEILSIVEKEFDSKRDILEHLYSYKNLQKTWVVNLIMLAIAFATLLLIIFPEYANCTKDFCISVYRVILKLLGIA